MKCLRSRNVLGALCLIGFCALQPAKAAAQDDAIVRSDFNCFLNVRVDGFFYQLRSNDSHFVLTPSGNMVATCHFDIPETDPLPENTTVRRDIRCVFFGIETRDCWAIVSKSGEVTLNAILNPSSD